MRSMFSLLRTLLWELPKGMIWDIPMDIVRDIVSPKEEGRRTNFYSGFNHTGSPW